MADTAPIRRKTRAAPVEQIPDRRTPEREHLDREDAERVARGDRLEDRLDRDFAVAWRPEPGAKVAGRVVELVMGENAYGAYPICTLVTDDGIELAIHAFHTTLRNALKRRRVQVGDEIGIRYLGQRQGAGGQQYHDYRLLVDQKPGEDFWSKVEDQAEEGAFPF